MQTSETQVYLQVSRRVQLKIDKVNSCQRAKRKFTCRFLGECSRKSTKSIRANERNASLLAGFSASAAENRQSQFVQTSETQVYLQVSRRVQPKIDNGIVKSSHIEKYILLLLREFCSVGAWLRNLRFIGFPNPMKIRGICLSGFGNPYTKKQGMKNIPSDGEGK